MSDKRDACEKTPLHAVTRRHFVAGAAAAAATGIAARPVRAAADAKYRAAVIGHSGRGNFGHGLDRVWLDVPGT